MENGRSKQTSLFMWALFIGLLSNNMTTFVMCRSVEDQKNYYYSPDPHAGTPPAGSHQSPPHGTPPSHGSTPPSNCGNPPSGHHNPSPAPPTHHSTPTPTPTYGGSPPRSTTPSTPTIITPPTTPTIPGISTPSPPFDPHSPPFSLGGTCDYWRTHPTLIWGLFGWMGTTMSGAFGISGLPVSGSISHLSLEQALTNTRKDGFGELYREGTASLLNSMVNKRFPFTTTQVRDNFVSALASNKAAASQAQVFKLANEGRFKPTN